MDFQLERVLYTGPESRRVLKITNMFCFQADVDNSGTIDYGEFIAATVHLNKLEREEHLVAAFQYFDKDGSGYITVDELQQACAEQNMEDLFLEDIIKEVDQDNVSLKNLVILINMNCEPRIQN